MLYAVEPSVSKILIRRSIFGLRGRSETLNSKRKLPRDVAHEASYASWAFCKKTKTRGRGTWYCIIFKLEKNTNQKYKGRHHQWPSRIWNCAAHAGHRQKILYFNTAASFVLWWHFQQKWAVPTINSVPFVVWFSASVSDLVTLSISLVCVLSKYQLTKTLWCGFDLLHSGSFHSLLWIRRLRMWLVKAQKPSRCKATVKSI